MSQEIISVSESNEEMKEDLDFYSYLENLELIVEQNAQNYSFLHFNNPTSSFSTRCDVIYKTLLRDCRKYYTNLFDYKQMRREKKLHLLSGKIEAYMRSHFSEFSEDNQREIKFYIGCMIYPKHMLSNKLNL